jgi:hypothetical protein
MEIFNKKLEHNKVFLQQTNDRKGLASYSLKSGVQSNSLLRANLLPKNNKNQNKHNITLILIKRALECRMYPGQAAA